MAKPTLQEIKDTMYKMIKDTAGMKKWKATDLHKACEEIFGEDNYDKRKEGKEAIKELIEEGRLVYTYFGGSYIEVPHNEGAANA
jgi:sulfite reductase alpha subunit-like flavoprotein